MFDVFARFDLLDDFSWEIDFLCFVRKPVGPDKIDFYFFSSSTIQWCIDEVRDAVFVYAVFLNWLDLDSEVFYVLNYLSCIYSD